MIVYILCGLAAAAGLAGAYALRRQEPFWAGGLLLGCLAAVCYAGASAGSLLAFELYYALGAAMFPGWIGAGSLRAIFARRLTLVPAWFVLALSIAQLALTLAAQPAGAIASPQGGNGSGVLVMGPWVLPTVLFNTFGLGFAAAAAFYAWWRAFRVQDPGRAALAIGLSVVVIGILVRSDAVYRLLARAGGAQDFMLLDVVAFGLVAAGGFLTRRLPGPLRRMLFGSRTLPSQPLPANLASERVPARESRP